MRRPWSGWDRGALFATAALVGLAVRAWQLSGRDAMTWNDSHDYLTSSHSPLLSLELWAGARPPAIPLLFKLVGGDGQRAMVLQVIVASLCWAALATVVAMALPAGWRRWTATALVVAVSVSSRATMWDQSLLSETLALAFLALVVAAALQLARRVTPWRGLALVGAAALWVAVRDAPAVALLGGALALVAVIVVARPSRGDVLAATAAGLVLVAAFTFAAAHRGQRDVQPLEHVLAVRVLPFPDRVDWFSDHGMPLGEQITALRPAHPVPDGPGVVSVPQGPPFGRWHHWLADSGRRTFLRWMATHPGYVVGEPWRSPERAFNNADGDLEFYRAPDFRHVPLIGVLSLPTPWLIPFGLLLAAALLWLAKLRTPITLCALVVIVTSVPHGLMAWHSDGMETARHLVVPGMQLRIGVVLLAVALLDRWARPEESDAAADATLIGAGAGGVTDGSGDGTGTPDVPRIEAVEAVEVTEG